MDRCKLGITSMSLGYASAGHDFIHKVELAAKYGYKGIELFWGDLQAVADSTKPKSHNPDAQLESAARLIRQACSRYGVDIICLQPFSQYEGLSDRTAHAKRIEQLLLWFRLAKILRTNMILIPATFLPAAQLATSSDLAIADLQEVADLGLKQKPPIRFAYEALCWSTRCDTWEASWEIIKAVNRSNFGICLDTFNIAGRIYADPTSPSGCNPDAKRKLQASVKRMLRSLPVDKIFFVQVVDAEKLREPLTPKHAFWNEELPPRMAWSRNCRLFYGEHDKGAYLPIFELCKAIFIDIGFTGWVSFELFNRRMNDRDEFVPEELAWRGAVAWQKLSKDMSTV